MKILRSILLWLFNPFVRVVGMINWRCGRPFMCNRDKLERVRHLLRPGMVVLTHREYELTNIFIRGYWKHSAMVISDNEIVEAVRQGVLKRPLEEFFQEVDDFMVLTPSFCDRTIMTKATEIAKKVIGYPYNFSFRPGEKSFYCTELIMNAYLQASSYKYSDHGSVPPGWGRMQKNICLPQNLAESKDHWQVVLI